MKVLTCSDEIRSELNQLKPSKVAVAFVGYGWGEYVCSKDLIEIVLCPKFGSNPKAIEGLIEEIGIDNVHFLNKLHSKFYIGDRKAILGSCNLSNNGIGKTDRFEAAVTIDDPALLDKLSATFDDYKATAKQDYPSKESKTEQLKKLEREWKDALKHGFINDKSPTLEDYQIGRDRIHVAWYLSASNNKDDGSEYDTVEIAKKTGITDLPLDKNFSGYMDFHEEDPVEHGDWILSWKCKKDGEPYGLNNIDWLYVHDVVSQGSRDDDYTKVALERKGRPCHPFELDKKAKNIIQDLLKSGNFPEMRMNNSHDWRLRPSDKVTPRFLAELRDRYIHGD